MLESFQVVGLQVLILFVLIMIGFASNKLKIIDENGVKGVTSLMLYIITPCVLINSFQREFDLSLLKGFAISVAAAVLFHIAAIFISKLLVHDENRAKQNVLRFGAIFANCGYMSLPLQQALLGSEAVFYSSSYVAVFNIFTWSYGLSLMCSGKEKASLKKAILNPGLISVLIGLVLFFCSVKLPVIIGKPIEYIAALNTPVPMIIIGYYIANLDFKKVLRTKAEFTTLAVRLVLLPMLMFGALYVLGIRGVLMVSCVISASAPIAAISTMFATKFGGDTETSAGMVAISTLFSIVTMTLIVSFAMWVAM